MYTAALLTFMVANHITSASASCAHNTHIYPRQEGGRFVPPDFGYEGEISAMNWHGIKPEYKLCATGINQTPINLNPAQLRKTNPGDVRQQVPNNQELIFENLGTNVELIVSGTTTFGGKRYKLKQFHYHTPSEHRILNENFPVEVHMVHEAEDNPRNLAVIAFIFEVTYDSYAVANNVSALFSNVINFVDRIPNPGDAAELPVPNRLGFRSFTSALPSLSFYTYSGSLTTPPCSEGVIWLIATETFSLSTQAYNALKKVVKFNSRLTQNRLGGPNLISLAANQLAKGF